MNANVTPAPAPPHLIVVSGRMTVAEYEAERAKLAPDRATAAIRWEQDLAGLFYRSGWTQDELAKQEGKSRTWCVYMLCFGRFLAFAANVTVVTNLTERRFRAYWERTAEHGTGNERIRFRATLELIEAEEPLRQAHKNTGHPKKIVERFGDKKWHALPTIAKALEAAEDEVERSLYGMVKDGRGGAKTEIKTVSGVKHYRIFRNSRMVSSDELIEKLTPILKGLEAEAAKNQVRVSPQALAILAGKLRRLLEEVG